MNEWMRVCGTGGVVFTRVCVPGTIGHTVHLLQIFTYCWNASHLTHITLHGANIFSILCYEIFSFENVLSWGVEL